MRQRLGEREADVLEAELAVEEPPHDRGSSGGAAAEIERPGEPFLVMRPELAHPTVKAAIGSAMRRKDEAILRQVRIAVEGEQKVTQRIGVGRVGPDADDRRDPRQELIGRDQDSAARTSRGSPAPAHAPRL